MSQQYWASEISRTYQQLLSDDVHKLFVNAFEANNEPWEYYKEVITRATEGATYHIGLLLSESNMSEVDSRCNDTIQYIVTQAVRILRGHFGEQGTSLGVHE